ncbi:MAG: hypothetical protein GX654_00310 [Desulfatiglans sp.]|jgi:hypothetical protein|nr:hypothetical protein [Desulfatiglans sp.]
MYNTHPSHRVITIAAFFLIINLFSIQTAPAQECDRECLKGMITQYIDALVGHDPSMLPLASDVRFTEDSKIMKLGEGLWKTVTSKDSFRHDYLDTKKQVAATHIVVREGNNQALCSVLLYVKDMKITGIETLIEHITPESRIKPNQLGAPISGMNDPVPAGKKQSRESLIKIALTYTEGLRIGNFTDAGTPFAPETYRVENGIIMAGKGSKMENSGMYEQYITLHPGIIASVAAVDEEMGIVLLWMNFGHTGSNYGEGNALVTFEAFKIWGNEIHSVLAFFRSMPISTARFWPAIDPIPR